MAFVVIYDACVLYPAPIRDLLIRIANTGIVRARWTEQILDECFRNIRENRPDLRAADLERTRQLMCDAVPDCLVEHYESFSALEGLPDPDDAHVIAAAIRCGAQVIVTFNLKDFPEAVLKPFGIEAKHPDDFVLETIDLKAGAVSAAVSRQASALKQPPVSLPQLLDTLRDLGLVQSVAALRDLLGITP